MYDALKGANPGNELYGFKGGPKGLLNDNYLIFDDEYINQYRNTGGFDILGSDRTKLETEEQFNIISKLGIDYIQGYYFSKPLPEKEFIKFVEEKQECKI